MSVDNTSASKPRSSMISAIFSGDNFLGSWCTTALPIIKLTETAPAPSTSLKPDSTADVHAPQVIPSTFRVVVAIWAGADFCRGSWSPPSSVRLIFVGGQQVYIGV